MVKMENGEVVLTAEEARDLAYFIDRTLDSDWDYHTSHFICSEPQEEGKRRMNPEMYDFGKQLEQGA